MAAFGERLQIRLRYHLPKLMIRVLLLVYETAEETHRDAGASLGHALMRDDRLQAGLEQLLGHL